MRVIVLLFGILSYVVFLIAFLYAIGFVGNLIVPKSIDSGMGGFSFSALLINSLLLGLFAVQHTIMARPAFKNSWTKIVGKAAERSYFVLLSSLILLLMYWQWRPMTDIVWNVENQIGSSILIGLFWLGWLIVFLSTFMINHFHLFGLTQIYDNLVNRELTKLKFNKNYLYKFVRHPIMLGFIIAFWATPTMSQGHLLFAVLTTGYIFIGVKYFEEKDLVAEIGEGYVEYQKEVPMLFPFGKGKK